MVSIVCLVSSAPSLFAANLTTAGCRVFEALAKSEVLHLCEHDDIDLIVIAPDVHFDGLDGLPAGHTIMALKPEGTWKDVLWELSLLSPDKATKVQ